MTAQHHVFVSHDSNRYQNHAGPRQDSIACMCAARGYLAAHGDPVKQMAIVQATVPAQSMKFVLPGIQQGRRTQMSYL